jgi:hypothetical protein
MSKFTSQLRGDNYGEKFQTYVSSYTTGEAAAQLVEALRYEPEGRELNSGLGY